MTWERKCYGSQETVLCSPRPLSPWAPPSTHTIKDAQVFHPNFLGVVAILSSEVAYQSEEKPFKCETTSSSLTDHSKWCQSCRWWPPSWTIHNWPFNHAASRHSCKRKNRSLKISLGKKFVEKTSWSLKMIGRTSVLRLLSSDISLYRSTFCCYNWRWFMDKMILLLVLLFLFLFFFFCFLVLVVLGKSDKGAAFIYRTAAHLKATEASHRW